MKRLILSILALSVCIFFDYLSISRELSANSVENMDNNSVVDTAEIKSDIEIQKSMYLIRKELP